MLVAIMSIKVTWFHYLASQHCNSHRKLLERKTHKKGKLLCQIKIEILGNLMTTITAHFIQKKPKKRYDVSAIRDNKRDQVFTPS